MFNQYFQETVAVDQKEFEAPRNLREPNPFRDFNYFNV